LVVTLIGRPALIGGLVAVLVFGQLVPVAEVPFLLPGYLQVGVLVLDCVAHYASILLQYCRDHNSLVAECTLHDIGETSSQVSAILAWLGKSKVLATLNLCSGKVADYVRSDKTVRRWRN
jgi:hypothetical protein